MPASGQRTIIEMDMMEYERMRNALGETWEWQGLVRIRDGKRERSVNVQRAEILRLARIRAGLNLREAAEIFLMSSRLLGDIEFARAECDTAQADLMLCVYLPYEERQR